MLKKPWTRAVPVEDPQRTRSEFLAGAEPMSAVCQKLAEGREDIDA
jgi:hypothetical protein